MKKILTLLIAIGAVASVQAQTSKEEARRVILGGGNSNKKNDPSDNRDVILGGGGDNRNSYPDSRGSYPSGNRQYEIDQINREYDTKIQSIRNNPYLSHEEKERAIRQLEKDRQKRIKQVNSGYNRNDDRDNNGKHKGWYKKNKNKNWKKGKRDRDGDDD